MRRTTSRPVTGLAIGLALVAAVAASVARPPQAASQAAPVPAAAASAASGPAGERLVEQGHYVNHDGQVVHSPAHTVDGAVPAGASARCGDGSYSFSTHRRGTCSHHGGVAAWL